jgi:hypothetical protein
MPTNARCDEAFDGDEELVCDECQEDDENERQDDEEIIDEPCEGDLVTEDHLRFYTVGGSYRWPLSLAHPDVTVEEDEDCQEVVKAYMDKQSFWPNVWFVSDHGNWHLLTLGEQP